MNETLCFVEQTGDLVTEVICKRERKKGLVPTEKSSDSKYKNARHLVPEHKKYS